MSIGTRLALFVGTGVALALVARYNTPAAHAARADQKAAALCRQRYEAARTAPDTAALDSLKTLTREGVAERTCGELRLAGRS
jgi:hypothetical protein